MIMLWMHETASCKIFKTITSILYLEAQFNDIKLFKFPISKPIVMNLTLLLLLLIIPTLTLQIIDWFYNSFVAYLRITNLFDPLFNI